jgi:hypothetical protein
MDTKACTKCKAVLPVGGEDSQFFLRSKGNPSKGYQSQCKICIRGAVTRYNKDERKSMATYIKEQTNSCFDAVDLLVRIMQGKLKTAKVSDRMQAASMLINRVYGKEVATQINLDATVTPLSEVETSDLISFLKNGHNQGS